MARRSHGRETETELFVKVVTVQRRQVVSTKIMRPKIAHVILINSTAAALFFVAVSVEVSVHVVRVTTHLLARCVVK